MKCCVKIQMKTIFDTILKRLDVIPTSQLQKLCYNIYLHFLYQYKQYIEKNDITDKLKLSINLDCTTSKSFQESSFTLKNPKSYP